jgi:SWI/SNF-related matrix-associated actin-dependent regulator 1 of chromatin subfamily A
MAVYKNKYSGTCNNPTCKVSVVVGAGFIQKINNRWVTWCPTCVPERIQPTAAQASARREFTIENGEGRVYTPYEADNLPLLRSMPAARWNKTGKFWNVSADEADRIRILEIADKLKLHVDASLRTVVETLSEAAQNAVDARLYGFQVEGVNWLSRREDALLGDDMGLGKTVQTLASLPAKGMGAVLAVVPAGLKYNWRDETNVWRPDYTPIVLDNKKNFRFPERGEIIIMNYEQLPDWLKPPSRTENNRRIRWNLYQPKLNRFRQANRNLFPQAAEVMLIVDEAHKVKNYKAQRSIKLTELVEMTRSVWGLTGTPLDNKPEDLYGVLSTLGMAFKTFGSFANYCRLMNATKGRWGGIEWGTPKPEVPERLRRVMLRRLRHVVLPDLPKKTYTKLVVGGMSAKLRKQLDELWDEFGSQVEIAEALPPFERFSEIRAALAKSRTKAMIEYVENAEEQDVPLVVFSAHLAPLDALLMREGWAVITGNTKPERRQEIVKEFQSGKLKGVGLTIAAGGVGLTLTRAWKALFVDLDWRVTSNTQAEDRIARIGQMSNCIEIIRMVSDHPMDLHVLNILVEKMRMIEATIEAEAQAHPAAPVAGDAGETEEQFEARMKAIEDAADAFEKADAERRDADNRERGVKKAPVILDREKERHARTKSAKTVLPLTDERVAAVKQAFDYMMSICDGATTRDGQGFNKPDAMVARFLGWAGMSKQVEVEAAYYMLTRYHRQLNESFPILWKATAADRKVLANQPKAG